MRQRTTWVWTAVATIAGIAAPMIGARPIVGFLLLILAGGLAIWNIWPDPSHRSRRPTTDPAPAAGQPATKRAKGAGTLTLTPTLSATVEKPKREHGIDYVFCVRNNSLSWYDVSVQVKLLFGCEVELTSHDSKTIWLPVSGTNAKSAPIEAGAYSVRFLFARQTDQQVALFACEAPNGDRASTGHAISTKISPENGKRIECEVRFFLGTLGHHDIEGIGLVKHYSLGWSSLEER